MSFITEVLAVGIAMLLAALILFSCLYLYDPAGVKHEIYKCQVHGVC